MEALAEAARAGGKRGKLSTVHLQRSARQKRRMNPEMIVAVLRKSCCNEACLSKLSTADIRHWREAGEGKKDADWRLYLASMKSVQEHAELPNCGRKGARLYLDGHVLCAVAFKEVFGISNNLWKPVLEIALKLTEEKHLAIEVHAPQCV